MPSLHRTAPLALAILACAAVAFADPATPGPPDAATPAEVAPVPPPAAVPMALRTPARARRAAGRRAPAPAVVLLDSIARVTARPRSRAGEFPQVFDVRVTRGADRYAFTTAVLEDSLPRALAALRRTTGWKRGYLFVRGDCGTGGLWKCRSEVVFLPRGSRLVALATLPARGDTVGTSLRDTLFRDLHADFEANALTTHAGAPGFTVLLRDAGGRLRADTALTWAWNARKFERNDSLARATAAFDSTDWDAAVTPRFENALLAKYCGRAAELAAVVGEARRVLPPAVFALLESELAKLEPGALPRASAAPRALAAPGAKRPGARTSGAGPRASRALANE